MVKLIKVNKTYRSSPSKLKNKYLNFYLKKNAALKNYFLPPHIAFPLGETSKGLKNYLKLSLPRFSHPDFILVLSHVLNRIYINSDVPAYGAGQIWGMKSWHKR